MGGLIGEGLAEYRIGQAAGAKGLPEGLARVFGHHILAVIPWHQYHDMAGAFPAFVTAMELALWFGLLLLFRLCGHDGGLCCGWRAHHRLVQLALNPLPGGIYPWGGIAWIGWPGMAS